MKGKGRMLQSADGVCKENFIVVERVSLAICDQSGMAWSDNENRSWHLWVVKVFLLCSLQIPFKHLIEYLQKCSRKVLIKVFFLIKSNFQTPCVFLSVVGMHGFQIEFWWSRASWHIYEDTDKNMLLFSFDSLYRLKYVLFIRNINYFQLEFLVFFWVLLAAELWACITAGKNWYQ